MLSYKIIQLFRIWLIDQMIIIIQKMKAHSIFQKLKEGASSFFLHQNQLHYKFQLLLRIMDTVIYVSIINGFHLTIFKQQFYTLGVLGVVCLLKCMFKISLGMGIYLLTLQQALLFSSMLSYINMVVMVSLIVGEIGGGIHFDVSLSNITAQSNNNYKIYHAALLTVNVILTFHPNMYFHLTSSLLFLLLAFKSNSLIKNSQFKQVRARLELCASFEHLRLFLANYIDVSSQIIIMATFGISQLLLSIYYCLGSKRNLFELSAKEQYLQLSFYLLSSYFDKTYHQEIQKFMRDLISEELQHQSCSFRDVSAILEKRLKRKPGLLQDLLIIEINIINGRLFKAKRMLAQAKEKTQWYHFIDLILIYRMEHFIAASYKSTASKVTIAYQKQYNAFLAFQKLIYKATLQNLKFHMYLKKNEIELANVKQMCSKAISYDQSIKEMYSQHFVESTQIYVEYLVKVKNNYQLAESIIQKRSIQEKYLVDFHLDKKIYLQFQLRQDVILINKVGFNAKRLLFYNTKQLEGQPVERLLPPFFRKCHQTLCSKLMHQQFGELFLYRKRTIILNSKDSYTQCNLMLKLNYRIGQQFLLQGYVHLIDNLKYDLSSFLFIAQNGTIIQSSNNVLQSQYTINNSNVQKYFNSPKIGLPLISQTQKGYRVYDPLIRYNGEESFYFYSKRVQKELFLKIETKQQNLVIKPKKQINKKVGKQKWEQVEGQIKSKQLLVLMIAFCVFLCGLFVSQYLLTLSASVKYDNQQFSVQNSQRLIRYFNYSLKLQSDFVYVDFRDNLNYTNSFIQEDFVNSAMQMQSLNEYLKKYVAGKYKLNTYNPSLVYYQNNFQALQMILSNANLYSKFRNDPFVRNTALDNYRLLPPVLVKSNIDYRDSIFNLMASFDGQDIFYDQLSFTVALANQIIFIFIIFRIYYKLGAIEQAALTFICHEAGIAKKIDQMSAFLEVITIETSPIDKMKQEMHVNDNSSRLQGDTTSLKSEMSLIKESPGRTVMNDSFNNTGFIEEFNKNSKQMPAQSRFLFRQGKTYRLILLPVIIFVLVLVSLTTANYIVNSEKKNLEELETVNSAILLYRLIGIYASRGITPTFTTILLKQIKDVNNIKTYIPSMQSYQTLLGSYILPVFPQASFPQFGQFSNRLNNIYYKQVCDYISCRPEYISQLNLNYVTVLKKLSANLSGLVNATINMSRTQFVNHINIPSVKLYIDLLFYTKEILTQYIIDTIMIYLQNYNTFTDNLYGNKVGYINSMIGLSALGLIVFLFFCFKLKKEIDLFLKITKLYQQD